MMNWTPEELASIQAQAAAAIDAMEAEMLDVECHCQCHEVGLPCVACAEEE